MRWSSVLLFKRQTIFGDEGAHADDADHDGGGQDRDGAAFIRGEGLHGRMGKEGTHDTTACQKRRMDYS